MLLYKIGMKSHRPEDYGNHSSKEESFMERTYAPLIRQFSSIKGYQAAYTLVYALDASEGGCCNICVKMPCSQRSGAM